MQATSNRLTANGRRGFTLVELLVVIGIIALLIAILMPALSRARKQALQASCGSNERQVTYAALAYANDWKQKLPTRTGTSNLSGCCQAKHFLSFIGRLPVIGFDTVTIWDWGTYLTAGDNLLGGMAFVLRDYLKNDFDIYVCPDGWYERPELLTRWSGVISAAGPGNYARGPGCWDFTDGLLSYRTGYLWLPHRRLTIANVANACGGPVAATDKPGEIAKTASDKPELLLMADFNLFTDAGNECGGDPCAGMRPPTSCGLGANHNATSFRELPVHESACAPQVFPPNIGRQENPDAMPLGMNRARIDARTTWLGWQDWSYYKWAGYDGSAWSLTAWHSF